MQTLLTYESIRHRLKLFQTKPPSNINKTSQKTSPQNSMGVKKEREREKRQHIPLSLMFLQRLLPDVHGHKE